MMKINASLGVVVIGAISWVQATELPLTWEEAVKEARVHHPALRRAALAVTSNRVDRRAAESGYYPRLSASSSWSNGLDGNPSSFSYGVSGSVNMFDGFRREGQLDQADASLMRGTMAYEVAEAEIRSSLRTAYVGVLHAQALAPLNEQILVRRREVAGLIHLQYEAGKEDKGSSMRADALASQAEADVESARRGVDIAAWELARELGRSVSVKEKVAGGLTMPVLPVIQIDRPEAIKALTVRTPAYRQALADERVAQAGLRMAESVWYPDLGLSAGWSQGGANLFDTSTRWNIGISTGFPFFNGGENSAQVEQAQIQLSQTAAATARTEAEIVVSLVKAHASLADAVRDVGIRKQLLEAAEVRAQIAKAQYTNGLLGYRDWDVIENEAVQTQRSLLAAQRTAMTAHAAWERALGKGLEAP